MSIFSKKTPEKNLPIPPTQEAKKEVKFVGNFEIESKDKEGLKTRLLSGNEITVLVNPKTAKIILGTPEGLFKDPEIPFVDSGKMMQYSYSILETSRVGNNNVTEGELHLSNLESAAIIERATGMTEPNARKIIEGKIKEHLTFNITAPARENLLSQGTQEEELARIKKLLEIKDIQKKVEEEK